MRDLLVTVTCDRLITLQITGLMERGTKERDCPRWRWHLHIEIGCITADLFMVLMYRRGAHLSVTVYTWLERMEISCGVNVTFLSYIPLSFFLTVTSRFGIFLKLCVHKVTMNLLWERSKALVFLDHVPWAARFRVIWNTLVVAQVLELVQFCVLFVFFSHDPNI